jgi:broad specificity phosphatase PhoE
MKTIVGSLLVAACAAAAATAMLAQTRPSGQLPSGMASLGQGVMFFVRHGEVGFVPLAGLSADPSLSEAGRARAISLATVLKDAGITSIVVSEYRRTRETAAPLANSLGLTPTIVPVTESRDIAYRLRRAGGNVLIVGHSNTLPEILQMLGLRIPPIGEFEFDNLYIATPGLSSASPRIVHLHYR